MNWYRETKTAGNIFNNPEVADLVRLSLEMDRKLLTINGVHKHIRDIYNNVSSIDYEYLEIDLGFATLLGLDPEKRKYLRGFARMLDEDVAELGKAIPLFYTTFMLLVSTIGGDDSKKQVEDKVRTILVNIDMELDICRNTKELIRYTDSIRKNAQGVLADIPQLQSFSDVLRRYGFLESWDRAMAELEKYANTLAKDANYMVTVLKDWDKQNK